MWFVRDSVFHMFCLARLLDVLCGYSGSGPLARCSMRFVRDSLFHMFHLARLLDVLCGSTGILCFTCFAWPAWSMFAVVRPGFAALMCFHRLIFACCHSCDHVGLMGSFPPGRGLPHHAFIHLGWLGCHRPPHIRTCKH